MKSVKLNYGNGMCTTQGMWRVQLEVAASCIRLHANSKRECASAVEFRVQFAPSLLQGNPDDLLQIIRTSVLSWVTHVRRANTQATSKCARSSKVPANRVVSKAVVVAAKQLSGHQDDAHASGANRCDLQHINKNQLTFYYNIN